MRLVSSVYLTSFSLHLHLLSFYARFILVEPFSPLVLCYQAGLTSVRCPGFGTRRHSISIFLSPSKSNWESSESILVREEKNRDVSF
jgi:hypothetical protein